jgi:multiple sugar transport system substrate-binding protein
MNERNRTREFWTLAGKGAALAILGMILVIGIARPLVPGPLAGERTMVRYWNGFTASDGRTMLLLVRQFNRDNPDIHVVMQRIGWETFYNKLYVAGVSGRAPEVFVLQDYAMPRFIDAGFVEPIDDLLMGEQGIDPADFHPRSWQAVEAKGEHMGLPLDIFLYGLYYNRGMLAEAGWTDADGEVRIPRNREEFIGAAQAMTRDVNRDGIIDRWGFLVTNPWANAYILMRQNGGRMFDEGRTRCVMDSPANIEALQFLVDLIWKYRVAPHLQEPRFAWISFQRERGGMAFNGVFMKNELSTQTLDYGGAAIPALGERAATFAGSHILCLRDGLEPVEREASWRFMRYLSDHSLEWAAAGQLPARLSLLETERFKRMTLQAAFAEQLDRLEYLPQTPIVLEWRQELNYAVERALRQTAPVDQALREASERVNAILERRRGDAGNPFPPKGDAP